MIINAYDKPYILRCIWFNFREVGDWAFRASVPERAGRWGLGWVDMYKTDGDGHVIIKDGEPIKCRRRYGFVKWKFK
jgi:hypothetical protein